ncbi:hypothetical protein JCM1393_22950 [Clostridium carnis]
MNSLDKAISIFIDKASKRIKLNFLLNLSIAALKLMLCLSFCLLLVSLFITFPYVEEVSIGLIILGLIISLIYGFIKAPNRKKVALIVDSKGLKERVITSLELVNCDDKIAIAQKEDTVNAIKDFNLKENLKISVEKKQIYLIIGLILMCFGTLFINTDSKRDAEKIRGFHSYQKEIIKNIEKEKKEIEKIEHLDEKEKEEVKKILEDAKKEVKESLKKAELNKTLERLEKKLESKKDEAKSEKGKKVLEQMKKNLLDNFNKEKEEEAKKDLNKLVNKLMKKEQSKKLGESIMSDDKGAVEKALSDIKKSLKNMSTADLNKLSDSLSKSSKEISDEELSEALENASSSVLDGKLNEESLSNAISKAKNNSNKNSSSNKNSNKENGTGQGDGEGEGQGQGNGQGQGQGQGAGQGTGWNTGSTVGNKNDLENKKGEGVYIPGRKEGNDSNLTGNKNQSGDSQKVESQNGLNMDGSKIDYDKVIGDYTNSALEGANNSNLPESLKNLIKDYFEGLN